MYWSTIEKCAMERTLALSKVFHGEEDGNIL